jgi:hypothetical protein
MEAGMKTRDRPARDWTAVLRRRPARIVAGRAEGGYTNMFEIICRDCGDQPDLDYREVSPELQRTRGPFPIAAGVTAYENHLRLHRSPARHTSPGGHA